MTHNHHRSRPINRPQTFLMALIVIIAGLAIGTPSASAHSYLDRDLNFLQKRTGAYRNVGTHDQYTMDFRGSSNKGRTGRIKIETQFVDRRRGKPDIHTNWFSKGWCPDRDGDADWHCTVTGSFKRDEWDQMRFRYTAEDDVGNPVWVYFVTAGDNNIDVRFHG